MASKKTKAEGTEAGSNIQKLVRSEVRKLMEAQHQSMMSMLETGGTLMLKDLDNQTTVDGRTDPQGSTPQRNGTNIPSHQVQSQQSHDAIPGEMRRGVSAPALNRTDGISDGSVISGQARPHAHENMQQHDGTDGKIETELVAHESQSNGVPPLQLEDLVSSKGSHRQGDGSQSTRDIPGMIRGFPLLTVPKDRLASARSEYDMIPTRDDGGARGGITPRQDIVLLRGAPGNVGEPPPRRGVPEPPAYKQTFTYGSQNRHGPPIYPQSGAQQPVMGGFPLLRILPERDHVPMLIQHPPQYPVSTYNQMDQPSHRHSTAPKPAHLNVNGQFAPPRPVPFEAWGRPAGGGTNQPFPTPGRIDIPLLRMDQSHNLPAVFQPSHLDSHAYASQPPLIKKTRIDLPLLQLKAPEPQPLIQPIRIQRPTLPLVSKEEILAYDEEKRRKELEREQEMRRNNGEPIQLLRVESDQETEPEQHKTENLAATSRQRRREKKRNRDGDAKPVDEGSLPAPNVARGPTRTKHPKQMHARTGTKTNGTNNKPPSHHQESADDEEEEPRLERERLEERGEDEREKNQVTQKTRGVVVVRPKESQAPVSGREAGSETVPDGREVEYPNENDLRPPQPGIQLPVESHDVETQVADLGRGYAIKPGTYDEALRDPEGRPLLPTSAQIHYETVMRLQQPPPVAKPREAETQTINTQDAATLTDGRGESVDEIRERLAWQRGAGKSPEDKPTPEEAEDQYTAAATGLNKAGNIIAPDIFFGLRFGRQGGGPSGPEGGQSSSSGRDFINVADINAEDVFRDIPQHPDSRDSRGRRQRDDAKDYRERDAKSGKEPKRRKEDDKENEEEEEDPTIAELHYKALFHRDAVPEDGLALLEEEEDEMDGVKRRKKIGDEVTRKMLEARLEKAERGFSAKAQVSESRTQTRTRIQDQLSRMNQRLGAIDEVSQSMQRDFSNTRLMLHTVEKLSEAMAHEADQNRSRPDYSLKDYKDPRREEEEVDDHHDEDISPSGGPEVEDEDVGKREELEDRGEDRGVDDGEKEEEEDMMDEEGESKEEADLERTEVTEGNMTLGISGISGVSDIIAQVIAGDDLDAEEFGITEHQQRAAKRRVKRQEKFDEEDLGDIPLTSLTDRQLRQIFSPRSALSPEERTKPWPFAAKPAERSEGERREIKDWMERKRAEQIADYKKKRGEKIEAEHKPFSTKSGALRQVPTSTKGIKKAEDDMRTKRKMKKNDHFDDRIADAKNLMAEILDEKPNISKEPSGPPRRQQRDGQRRPPSGARAASSRQAASTPQPRGGLGATRVVESSRKASHSGNRAVGDGRVSQRDDRPTPKGTYMFIDSEAYRGPPRQQPQATLHGIRKDTHGNRQGREGPLDDRTTSYHRRSQPLARNLHGSLERSVQFAEQRRSSEDDLQLVLEEMSDLVTPRGNDDDEKENASDWGSDQNVTEMPPTRRSYTDVVRVQRPQVTRRRDASPRKPKTYSEMLQEMKAEVGSGRQPSSADVKARQRLYGSKRLPGWNKGKKQYSKTPKTYTQRLAEMRGAQGPAAQDQSERTRLVQRPRPRPQQHMATATMTLGPSHRQQVERRGITPEPGPRSTTPYTAMLAELSNSGTHRGRDPVISPRANPGMRSRTRTHEPVPYVDRLKQNAAESAAKNPPRKYRTVYAPRNIPTGSYTHKAPPLRTPSPRQRPYGVGSRRPMGGAEDERSDVSDLSPWSVSDDVRKILDEDSDLEEGLPTIREPLYELDDDLEHDEDYGDYANTVDIRELEELASMSSGSIMSNIDWAGVDTLIADVE